MVDVADSKSADGDIVWVRVPPPAPKRKSPTQGSFAFMLWDSNPRALGKSHHRYQNNPDIH